MPSIGHILYFALETLKQSMYSTGTETKFLFCGISVRNLGIPGVTMKPSDNFGTNGIHGTLGITVCNNIMLTHSLFSKTIVNLPSKPYLFCAYERSVNGYN